MASLTGTAVLSDGVTTVPDGTTVTAYQSGSSIGSASTVSGTYSITATPAVAGLALVLSNGVNGITFYKYVSGNVLNVKIIQNQLTIAKAGTAQSPTQADLASATNNGALGNIISSSSPTSTVLAAGINFDIITSNVSFTMASSGTMTVPGNFSISYSGGTASFVAGTGTTLTVGGDFNINHNTFTPSTSTVILNGTAQAIKTSIATTISFYNLSATNAGDVITVNDGLTVNVTNALTLTGVTLQGSSTGGWTLAVPATQAISGCTVSYSTATGNTAVDTGGTDGGHNVNWTFPVGSVPTQRIPYIGIGIRV